MTCDEVQQCLLDEALPRPDGLDAHVLGCDACRAFAESMNAARRLKGAVPFSVRRVPVAKAKRRLQLVAALGVLSAGLVVEARLAHDSWVRSHAKSPTPVAVSPSDDEPGVESPNRRLVVAPEAPDAEETSWRAMRALARSSTAARRNLRVTDASYRPFGTLATWVAPRPTQPIRSLHLGKADSPLIHTSEDSP